MSETNPSDAPQREPGTRTRSGNAMLRTRSAILDAAAGCVERYGVRKTTMSDVATQAGVAKATLYNHFRTKDDVLAALVTTRVQSLGTVAAAVAAGRQETVPGMPDPGRGGLAAALEHVADELSRCAPLRRVAAEEPAVLGTLVVPGPGRTWGALRAAVVDVLEAADVPGEPPAVDLVLRWLLAQATWPGTREEVRLGAGLLERGLVTDPVVVPAQAAPAAVAAPAVAVPSVDPAPADGLGWPG